MANPIVSQCSNLPKTNVLQTPEEQLSRAYMGNLPSLFGDVPMTHLLTSSSFFAVVIGCPFPELSSIPHTSPGCLHKSLYSLVIFVSLKSATRLFLIFMSLVSMLQLQQKMYK